KLKKTPTRSSPPSGPVPSAPDSKAGTGFLLTLLCLVVVLSALFNGSFEPSQIVFSNDGPLGTAKAQEGRGLYNMRGFWQDLNWIGIEQPGGILSSGYLLLVALGPVLAAKFIAPISLLILGLSAWLMFRQWRFHPAVCLLGALAAALNTDAF